MLVSVIMPVYNGIQFLRESIESILNQSYQYLEFIILDDGSTESVWDLIQSYNDTRIVALRNAKNIGITKSLNICLDRVHGNFIIKHDSDDISLPNRIEKQLAYFEEGVGFVGCWARSIDAKGNFVIGHVDTKCRISDEDLISKYPKLNCMTDPTSVYSKEAVRKIGYFDEEVYYGQTYNYNRRIQKFFKGRVVPEILYYRRIWKDQVGKRVRRKLHSENKIVNWLKLSNEFAEIRPIIKERSVYPWEKPNE